MKSTLKLIRRFLLTLILSLLLLLVLNVVLLLTVTYNQIAPRSPWGTADAVSAALVQKGDGSYQISEEGATLLKQQGAWAILVDNNSGMVKWSSSNLPEGIPKQYTLSDLSWAVRGYIKDYPTTTSAHGDDLLILGNPKTAYWKLMWNTFDYNMISHVPQMVVLFVIFNLIIIFIIYTVATSGMLRSIKPIVKGIEALPERQEVYIKEKGLLSDLEASINRTSEKLRTQEYNLKKKETARANWIAGVSHDIRTPLSMVLGYASQLEEDSALPEIARKQAGIIRMQSLRMKNLINDLNLASKLEYNVQPVHKTTVNAVSLVRKVVVDFLNMDADGQYPIVWKTDDELISCNIQGDADLLKRALSNLILNAQVHNPEGCTITAKVSRENGMCHMSISDDGVGVSEEQLASIRNAPHYMVCDSNTGEQRHGLGLLIVEQIAQAHGGQVEIDHAPQGGFMVTVSIPISS